LGVAPQDFLYQQMPVVPEESLYVVDESWTLTQGSFPENELNNPGGSFSFSCVFTSGYLRGVLGSKAAIASQHGVAETANFIKSCHDGCPFRLCEVNRGVASAES
jgi:hypothetical protein